MYVAMPVGMLGNTIKAHRVSAKLTLAELAEKASISTNHMQRIESAKSLPSVPLLYELARILTFSLDEAFFGSGPKEGSTLKALQRRMMECDEHGLRILLSTANAILDK